MQAGGLSWVGDLLALARLEQGALEVRSEAIDLAEVAREAERRRHGRGSPDGAGLGWRLCAA